MNATLQTNDRLYHALFGHAVDAILIIDHTGVIQQVNPAAEKLFGYRSDALLGEKVNRLMPPPHADRHDDYLSRFLTGEGVGLVGSMREVEGLHADGYTLPLELSVNEFTINAERYFLGILRDSSERHAHDYSLKLAHAALSEANRNLESTVHRRTAALQQKIDELEATRQRLTLADLVIRSTSEAVVITDSDNTIVDVNDAYLHITGYSRDEIIGGNPRMLQSGCHDDAFYRQMWNDIRDNGFWKGEIWDRRKDGELYPQWLTINALYNDADEVSHYVGVFSDISDIKEKERELNRLTHYDPLTGLPNRTLFRYCLEQQLSHAKRHQRQLAIFYIDLDQFKDINDTLGHHLGDQLLIEVAHRLKRAVRGEDGLGRFSVDTPIRNVDGIARLGGDEFTVTITELENDGNLAGIARRLQQSVNRPLDLEGHEVHIDATIGIAIYPRDGRDFDELTRNADTAMNHAKRSGRGDFNFYSAQMNESARRRLALQHELRGALSAGQFELHFQPKVDSDKERLCGLEALIRWHHPTRGLVSPLEFIPLAEEIGLIHPIGEWVIAEAARRCVELRRLTNHPVKIAVNLSSRQFNDSDLLRQIDTTLEQCGLPASGLELEITESMVMNNVEHAITTMALLRERGITIAIDDFGTGYSSFSYLKRFPVSCLKIDRSFIKDIEHDSDSASITATIIMLARQMGLEVVAEGAETAKQVARLKELGCTQIQGFYYSRPLPFEELKRFIDKSGLCHRQKGK